jgi:endonuclease YncB( thermonuclease family)
MSRSLRRCVLAALAVVVLAPSALPAATLYGYEERGDVTGISDGDTFNADVNGDAQHIRMVGIQAMESGECHADKAESALRSMIFGKEVVLRAYDPDSSGLRDRPLRFTDLPDGTDVGATLLRAGHVMWFPKKAEWSRNFKYYTKAKAARAQKVGMWSGTSCASGPQQSVSLDMWVQWDADSNDNDNPNGEWVRIKNRSGTALQVGGWLLRDSSLLANRSTEGFRAQFKFPAGAKIPAHRSVTVHVGRGTKVDNRRYYWGLTESKFANADYKISEGDGAYLFDTDGDMRASFMYPCMPRTDCTDPLRRKVVIRHVEWNPDGDESSRPNREFVDIRNTSSRTVYLEKRMVESYPYNYEFGPKDKLRPGQTLRLHVGKGRDYRDSKGRLRRFWGHRSAIFGNSGDWVRIKNFEDVEIDCERWGGVVCGQSPKS